MSTVVAFRSPDDHAREAGRIADHLRRGGLLLYPTETVYGLGCALRDPALARLAELKGREATKTFLLLISGPEQAPGLEWTVAARRLAAAFWPGPLTLALRATPGTYPAAVVGRDGTVAVRVSPHPAVQAIVGALGEPITSTSANLSGEPPAATMEGVTRLVERLGSPRDLWVADGGTLPASSPSTIVDCAAARPRVIREGAVPLDALRTIVDEIDD